MTESLFARGRAQVRYPLHILSDYSDSKCISLLLIQIPYSYKLNLMTVTCASQNGVMARVIGVTE